MKNILVTGGYGFIGSNFVMMAMARGYNIINVDKMTYAANPTNIKICKSTVLYKHYKIDICDTGKITQIMKKHDIDTIVHFAAESHVDNSIDRPGEFMRTNIMGTYSLLDAALAVWKFRRDVKFHHVSTDEVYGALGAHGKFTEISRYDPKSPYSASKASSDHIVRAFHNTYGLPITISNCSNNYGPNQHVEKLIPKTIMAITKNQTIPVYGKGQNVRDWLYVEDHCNAIMEILKTGKQGETYNIGGDTELSNIDLVTKICEIMGQYLKQDTEAFKFLITFVKDRPGHDFRYAIDHNKITKELEWKPSISFHEGIRRTINHYVAIDILKKIMYK